MNEDSPHRKAMNIGGQVQRGELVQVFGSIAVKQVPPSGYAAVVGVADDNRPPTQ